jgi:hypothetical protein
VAVAAVLVVVEPRVPEALVVVALVVMPQLFRPTEPQTQVVAVAQAGISKIIPQTAALVW